jgi:hypothetical protein
MCGAGLYTALDANYPCLQRVVLNFGETLVGCIQTYQTNVGHDPANGCRYDLLVLTCHFLAVMHRIYSNVLRHHSALTVVEQAESTNGGHASRNDDSPDHSFPTADCPAIVCLYI